LSHILLIFSPAANFSSLKFFLKCPHPPLFAILMSEDPDWVNLNPEDSQNSNFYYNASEEQFSLSPVYKREDLSLLLGSLKSKCNFLNFDYLSQLDQFKDIVPINENEPLKDLGQYAEEDVFLNSLGKNLMKIEHKPQISQKDSSSSVNVKRKNPLKASFFENFQKKGEIKEESEENSGSSSDDSSDEELTFKDLKNFNFPKAYSYRLTDEEQLKMLDFEKFTGYFLLLKAYFLELFKENVGFQYKKSISGEEITCQILINGDLLVELDGKTEKKCLEKVSQLLLAFFSPNILKIHQETKEKIGQKRKKIKREGLNYKEFNSILKKNGEKSPKNENSEVISNDSHDEIRNYKELLPRKLTEEELRISLDEVLIRRTFSFSNFLSEMKTEILKTTLNKDKKVVEKNTMRKCLTTLENLFRYYKLVKKQKKEDDILIFSHNQEGEFKVSIMERQENGEKKLISFGANSFKSFAIYFALSNFFENHLKGSYNTINKVYEEIKKMDGSYKTNMEESKKNDGPLDMISQDLLNEIDNYALKKI